jgi:putative component of toxin-antitoxin plasmid stabilization module
MGINIKDEKKLRETFKDMLIDVIDDFDPIGAGMDAIKGETGMGFKTYLQNKEHDFIERLKDKGFKV